MIANEDLHEGAEMNSQTHRGRIRIQLVALLLLGIAVSMIISAAKSLSREFVGLVVDTHAEDGLRSGYWLDLSVTAGLSPEESSAAFVNAIRGLQPTRRVGVSSMVYDYARPLHRVSKKAWSGFIYVEEERHIDLGIKWLIWGIIGLCSAIIIHGKTKDRNVIPISSLDDDDADEGEEDEEDDSA